MSFVSGTPPPFISNPSSSTQIAADTEKQILTDNAASSSTKANAGGDLNAGYFAYLNANPTQQIGTASFNAFYNNVLSAGGPDLSKSDRASLQLAAVQVAGEDNIQADDSSKWPFNGGQP